MGKSLQEMTEEEVFNAMHLTVAQRTRWKDKHFHNDLTKNPPPIDPKKLEFISTRLPGIKFDYASGRWVADV